MSDESQLSSEEVFRSFWLMCVALADLVYSYGQMHPGELRCEWRRHSLVITCKYSSTREFGVQRRKDLAFCIASPERKIIWQARVVPNASGQTGFAYRGNVTSASSAATSLFQSVMTHFQESRVETARAAGQG